MIQKNAIYPVPAKIPGTGSVQPLRVVLYYHRRAVLIEDVPSEIQSNPSIHPSHPRIAFEHLSLYLQKHLSQSVAPVGDHMGGHLGDH